jgi:hypothetical protein
LGILLSCVLIVGFAPRACLLGLWMLYLSLVNIGNQFYSFQWDSLLLETLFFSFFFAPRGWRPSGFKTQEVSARAHFLLKVLLFKLMFMSGLVKLTSQDPSWHQLSAMTFHYVSQPLPTFFAWFVYHWPIGFHHISCLLVFIIELGIPFLIFAPRRMRLLSCSALILFQILILLTGNYAFFNYLTILLCLLLLSDRDWKKQTTHVASIEWTGRKLQIERVGVFFVVLLNVSIVLSPLTEFPLFSTLRNWIGGFKTVNAYGLFAVMTTRRFEIIVEGSRDGKTWKAYEFRFKPDDIHRTPQFVAPYQPRLDWQMWFAALTPVQMNRWFFDFCGSLLQGHKPVEKLLKTNPFSEQPPKYVRALFYEYYFSGPNTKKKENVWWQRELKGYYCPPIALDAAGQIQLVATPNEN